MRFYVAMLAALGVSAGACGKKEPKPEPATAQVNPEPKIEDDKTVAEKPEPKDPEKPETPPDPAKPDEAVKPEDRKGPADRTAAVQEALAAYAAGNLTDAFKWFAEDITWTEVGMPDGEFDSLDEIVAYHKRTMTGFSDLKVKAARIIESTDYQTVEFVWQAKHTGAFADGTAATNKDVSMPAAMLLHYDDAGLVDKIWTFQDWPNVLQQLGVTPGLPEGFTAQKLPEQTEVVKGEFNAGLKDIYTGFGARMKPDTVDAAIDELWADDFVMPDFMTGKVVTGKEQGKAAMKQYLSMFNLKNVDVQTAIGAGDYLVTVTKNELEYKGGMPGVEAKEQDVTMHTLDISKFQDGKFKSYTSYGNSYEILAGLGLTAGTAAKPPDAAADAPPAGELPSFGVASCDLYVKGITACVDKMPEASRATFRDAMAKTLDSWKQVAASGDAAKQALEQGCKSALDSAKTSMASMCPDVKWE